MAKRGNIISDTCSLKQSQFSIDTIKLFICKTKLGNFDYEGLFDKINASQSYKGYSGFYKGIHIGVTDYGITLTGSISNYYCGSGNFLHHSDLKKAVSKLGKELGLDLHNSRLYRVDINFNMITDKPVSLYSNSLFTDLPRFKRHEKDTGVLFKTNSKNLIFYNKSLELLNKKLVVKDVYRIEFRILNGVKKFTGMEFLSDLYKTENYLKLVDMFYSYYKMVKKPIETTNLNVLPLNKINECIIFLLIKYIIQKPDGLKWIFKEIENLDKLGRFATRQLKYKLRKKINDVTEKDILKPHHLVKEIDQKFLHLLDREKAAYQSNK